MGHQITIYLTPADQKLLEHAYVLKFAASFIARRSSTAAPTILNSLDISQFGKTPIAAFIVPTTQIGALTVRRVSQQPYWTIDLARSPAIEMLRCFYDGRVLRSGRLYYESGFFHEADTWMKKMRIF